MIEEIALSLSKDVRDSRKDASAHSTNTSCMTPFLSEIRQWQTQRKEALTLELKGCERTVQKERDSWYKTDLIQSRLDSFTCSLTQTNICGVYSLEPAYQVVGVNCPQEAYVRVYPSPSRPHKWSRGIVRNTDHQVHCQNYQVRPGVWDAGKRGTLATALVIMIILVVAAVVLAQAIPMLSENAKF